MELLLVSNFRDYVLFLYKNVDYFDYIVNYFVPLCLLSSVAECGSWSVVFVPPLLICDWTAGY